MRRIVVGMSGASGAPLTVELLKELKSIPEAETHFVYTKGAEETLRQETGITMEEMAALADVVYDNSHIGAAIASGSFRTEGMLVVPCSMKTAAGIASGYSENLLLRAADVILKERRKLVLAVRECPLSSIHLRNLLELSQAGAVILPSVLTYYQHPESVSDLTRHMVGKLLDQFGLDCGGFRRWDGSNADAFIGCADESDHRITKG